MAEERARNLIEKRTAINLVEAFSVSVKHYLRGEEGIYYEDLYHLVKFLPAYSLPAGMPPQGVQSRTSAEIAEATGISSATDKQQRESWSGSTSTHLPTSNRDGRASFQLPAVSEKLNHGPTSPGLRRGSTTRRSGTHYRKVNGPYGEVELAPSSDPPKWGVFDVWPLSLLVKLLTKRGKNVAGKKAAKERARHAVVSHNIPLEITLYMVRGTRPPGILQNANLNTSELLHLRLAATKSSGCTDNQCVPCVCMRNVAKLTLVSDTLLLGLNQLVDSLSGLERILTTPIPFS
jgi:putative membrane protein